MFVLVVTDRARRRQSLDPVFIFNLYTPRQETPVQLLELTHWFLTVPTLDQYLAALATLAL
jgi:hypothetical protein